MLLKFVSLSFIEHYNLYLFWIKAFGNSGNEVASSVGENYYEMSKSFQEQDVLRYSV